MVATEWMKSVKEALKTIPKNTPNRLGAAMKKAKLTYKKGSSSSSSTSSNAVMKKTYRHRKSHKGRKGSRKHHSRRKGHRGGSQVALSPSNYGGLQLDATNYST